MTETTYSQWPASSDLRTPHGVGGGSCVKEHGLCHPLASGIWDKNFIHIEKTIILLLLLHSYFFISLHCIISVNLKLSFSWYFSPSECYQYLGNVSPTHYYMDNSSGSWLPPTCIRCCSLGSHHSGFPRSSVLSVLSSTPGATTGALHLSMFWPELSSALLLQLSLSQPSANVHLTADFIFPGCFLEDPTSYCHHLYGDLLALSASGRLTP